MKRLFKKICNSWFGDMLIINLVTIIVITIWVLDQSYSFFLSGEETFEEATNNFWKTEIIFVGIALIVVNSCAAVRAVIRKNTKK